MPVPLLDLKAQYATIREEIRAAVDRVLEAQRFILGPEVEALERELAAYTGVAHAVGVSSGTDALLLALTALDIGPGDEVLTTPYTFFATAATIHRVGATPIFADIDPRTYNLDPDALEAALRDRLARGGRVRAILPVHLFGLPAEMGRIGALARRHGLAVIEDAAQAIGAEYAGETGRRRAGAMGAIGCFSFFPSKNLGGAGDGGLCTTDDARLAARLSALRVHGSRRPYEHEEVGVNARLDALQAAILRVKLRHLEGWHAARAANAERYRRLFREAGLAAPAGPVELPADGAPHRHVYHQFVVRVPARDALRAALTAAGIGCAVYYPRPLHLQPCFAHLGYREGAFPQAERAARETLALPIYPELTEAQQAEVVEAIARFYR
ncbi:MAG TPA: DegT/DnrJ/EryC1/StrS family aminotransferase [Thermodesulfobacteriota bacterium]|nr:DegT/DnrJ/EryC1/StrS family aminotransferase [Thermodesulfobacteriota bacterium]